MKKFGYFLVCLVALGFCFAPWLAGQYQQNGSGAFAGAGAGANVGTPGAAAPRSAALNAGVYNTTPPTYSNGQMAAFQTDVNGNLKIAGTMTLSNPSVSLSAALPAGTNLIGSVKAVPATSCGTTVFTQALVAVPTSTTALTATTSCIDLVVFTNTTNGTLSVTITDGAGSPVALLNAFDITAKSNLILPLHGLPLTSGIKWFASGSGVTGGVVALQ